MRFITAKTAGGGWDEVTLPNGPYKVTVQARTAVDVQVDFTPGAHSNFYTVKSGATKEFGRGTGNIFIKAAQGTVIEVELGD